VPDIFHTSVSGLLAFQRALATTSHNIANAGTEGYTRQRVELGAREPQGFGSGFVGQGVDVTTVRRLLDQFADGQLRSSGSELGRLGVYSGIATRIDMLFGDPDSGVGAALQRFFAAVQDVATDPASVAARQAMLGAAQSLAERFRSAAQQLDQIDMGLRSGLAARVGEVNQLAADVARLNGAIVTAGSTMNGQPPNDLLDERDRLVRRLAELVNVTTVPGDDGAVNVFIGSGQALVLGPVATTLAVGSSDLDRSRQEILLRTAGLDQVITPTITGGEIGGLLQARGELLDLGRQQLGLAATGLAFAVNDQQARGLDLQGEFGRALFSLVAPRVLAAVSNSGSAGPVATVLDAGTLTGGDYLLRFDGSAWTVSDAATGVAVPLTGSGSAADPLRFAGLAVVTGAGATAGDRFMVQGTAAAAASLAVTLADPRGIAAAAPIRTLALSGNLGNGTISAGEVVDPADPDLLAAVEIRFLTGTTYSINGAGSFAWTPGADINVNGWRVRLDGSPRAGDGFRIERNTGANGDNRNALLLAGLQTERLLSGGTTSVGDSLNVLAGRIGTLAAQAEVAAAAQETIHASARDALLSESGVNLDEEAAELLKWQRAYQAAAQAITVADTLFQALLLAIRR
jgi:flagellar hook-associated protein 1 FlgK